jgi:LacI family transcriptional regulator
MQTILRNFFACARPGWHLSTRSVPPGTDAAAVVESLAETDLVLFHYTQEPRELLQELIAARRQAVASLGLPRPDLDCLTVDHDRTAGARAGVEHLLHLGYRRVAFVGSEEYWGDLSFTGYAEALAAYGQAVDPARVVRTGEPREEGLRAATVLDGRGTDFDAVFVDSDSRALGVLEGLRRTGRRVPTEVGVMGYDGLDAAVYHPPHLTSVAIPYQPMLRAALEAAAENDFAPTPRRHLEFVGRVVAGRTAVAQDSGEMAS